MKSKERKILHLKKVPFINIVLLLFSLIILAVSFFSILNRSEEAFLSDISWIIFPLLALCVTFEYLNRNFFLLLAVIMAHYILTIFALLNLKGNFPLIEMQIFFVVSMVVALKFSFKMSLILNRNAEKHSSDA